jgi:hypothetical protein
LLSCQAGTRSERIGRRVRARVKRERERKRSGEWRVEMCVSKVD